jgi:MFS family permease
MQSVKASLLYFIFVFGIGFVLGPIRILWLVPRFGVRVAELMEMPVMLVVIIFAARWIVPHIPEPRTFSRRLVVGLLALGLLLLAEFSLVLVMRGMTITEYLASRDPVSGTVYYIILALFAVMPMLVVRR